MNFGVYVPPAGPYDIRALGDLARLAEDKGWDGFFVWDNLIASLASSEIHDTTVALTAICLSTSRINFGPLVSPLTRRRPWKFAKEAATLDRLSNGRLILGVGLGGRWDFAPLGEVTSEPERAKMLDEGLEVISKLWRDPCVSISGSYYVLDRVSMRPPPLQQPRIPVWVAGYWPGTAPFKRAARWDGVAPVRRGKMFEGLTVPEFRACIARIEEYADGLPSGFNAVYFHTPDNRAGGTPEQYQDVGATWWLDCTLPEVESFEQFRSRISAGPPRFNGS